MYLSQLTHGESATITELHTDEGLRRRLQEVGFIIGASVKCLMRSPLGDPAAYRVCGATIALRDCDAATVEIERGGTEWV